MPKDEPSKEEGDKYELVVGGSLSEVPIKSSRPLDEMVERSLVSIRTSKHLSTMHRIGEHELCDPDYRLVCAWAEQTGKSNEEVLEELLKKFIRKSISVIKKGRFVEIGVLGINLPITSLPDIGGLVIENLKLFLLQTLTELDLSSVPNLEGLYCGGTNLTELDLSVVPNLTDLHCGGANLTELDLSFVPNLTTLTCSENNLTELDIRPLQHLKVLKYDNDKTHLIKRDDQKF
jgi:hypothetical protein